jgi:hypothetical protein
VISPAGMGQEVAQSSSTCFGDRQRGGDGGRGGSSGGGGHLHVLE